MFIFMSSNFLSFSSSSQVESCTMFHVKCVEITVQESIMVFMHVMVVLDSLKDQSDVIDSMCASQSLMDCAKWTRHIAISAVHVD